MSEIAKILELVEVTNQIEPDSRYKPKTVLFSEKNKAPEFAIDGVIACGVTLLAAYAGAGKTTGIVRLALLITGLIEDNFFDVTIKRKVIIFTEHAEQIEEIITAMVTSGVCSHSRKEVHQKIILAEAVRMSLDQIIDCAQFIEEGDFLTENKRSNRSYMAKPLAIFDTSNANFDLENENDSQDVGKMMAMLKTELFIKRGIPTLISAHTSKTSKHGSDAGSMSVRGSGAFEGDCTQVMYLTVDATNRKFLEIGAGKRRFLPKTDSIEIISDVMDIEAIDVFGDLITYPVTYISGLVPNTKAQRDAEKKQGKEAAKAILANENKSEKRQVILDVLESWTTLTKSPEGAVIPSKNQILKKISGNRENNIAIFDELVSEGVIICRLIDKAKKEKYKEVMAKKINSANEDYYWPASKEGDYFE